MIVLEKENWSSDEWKTLCKLCGLPAQRPKRIVLSLSGTEFYTGSDE